MKYKVGDKVIITGRTRQSLGFFGTIQDTFGIDYVVYLDKDYVNIYKEEELLLRCELIEVLYGV